ncbi:MAG: histidine kinase dimerization/phospho-acceptor domain-containing protein [Actinomycetaceae bacterium]|nr:histidine kinase dimerization/phospho-acceptor domain-containing protein [Actinomycetaceae bacterium]
MRERALRIAWRGAAVAMLLLGVPLFVLGPALAWQNGNARLQQRAETIARYVDRVHSDGHKVTPKQLEPWIGPGQWVQVVNKDIVQVGTRPGFPSQQANRLSAGGTTVTVEGTAWRVLGQVALVGVLVIMGATGTFAVASALALREARRIAAPLIYLAAQAEQVGQGQVRAQIKPCGIEEIDLVAEELRHSSERIAGKIAAERQFASDASHQLRTPLTALSMRIEEIELISGEPEVQEEARKCLEQVERLTQTVSDLLTKTRVSGGSAEAINVDHLFAHQHEEWEQAFAAKGRPLEFVNDAARFALATPGNLAQVLATLIENSLHYGGGKTLVKARPGTSSRSIFIEVSDEGEGVPDRLGAHIFDKGVSGHGSTGIGLALARELTVADGGRLELTQMRPPVFTISLGAVPLDPDKVMPKGALVSVGRRRRRF